MKEVKFSSVKDALQFLSDLTGKKIRIAERRDLARRLNIIIDQLEQANRKIKSGSDTTKSMPHIRNAKYNFDKLFDDMSKGMINLKTEQGVGV